MVIAVAFILSVAGIFLSLMLMALVMEAWPLFVLIALWLIVRDTVRARFEQSPVASRTKV